MIKKIISIILIVYVCITPAFATKIPAQDSSIYVNDYADVIDEETKQKLVSTNQQSDYEYGGYVVVVTLDFVEDDLYDYSYKLFNQWGIGDEDNNNGVLLVLDIGNDNYCYILGTGIEKILSDSEAKSIIDQYMEPDFAAKDYSQAVLKTSNQFLNVIKNGGFTVNDNEPSHLLESGVSTIGTIIGILIILIIIGTIFPRRGPRRRYRRPPPPPPPYPRRGFGGPIMGPRVRSRPASRPRPRSGPSGGFGGGSHHSGGSSRGAGGTRR